MINSPASESGRRPASLAVNRAWRGRFSRTAACVCRGASSGLSVQTWWRLQQAWGYKPKGKRKCCPRPGKQLAKAHPEQARGTRQATQELVSSFSRALARGLWSRHPRPQSPDAPGGSPRLHRACWFVFIVSKCQSCCLAPGRIPKKFIPWLVKRPWTKCWQMCASREWDWEISCAFSPLTSGSYGLIAV